MEQIVAALNLVSQLNQFRDKISDLSFKNMLADLAHNLADAKMEISNLKSKIVDLEEENRKLKQNNQLAEEKRIVIKGCYQFPDDENFYCIKCFELTRQKRPTIKIASSLRKCPTCSSQIIAK